MAKKYEGSWGDSSLLKDLMDKGEVYVECPHCGEHIQTWFTILEGKCYKCGQPHGLDNRLVEGEHTAVSQNKEQKYAFIKKIFLKNKGCLINIEAAGIPDLAREGFYSTPTNIVLLTGDSAWEKFSPPSHTWCFICKKCRYIHILNSPRAPADAMSVSNLYSVERRGYDWSVSFICQKCGFQSTNLPHPGLKMEELNR